MVTFPREELLMNRNKGPWTVAAVAIAMLVLTSTSANAQTIVYQDTFDGDGLEDTEEQDLRRLFCRCFSGINGGDA